MTDKRKSRFSESETIEVKNGDDLLDAGKEKENKPFIDLSNLNSKKFKTLTSSYSTTEKHENMLQEMIEESGKTKSGFIRYMIETFYEMSRK